MLNEGGYWKGEQQEKLEEGVAYRENQTCSYLLIVLTKPFNWVEK